VTRALLQKQCHFAVGRNGALDLVKRCGVELLAVCDVLSFSTTVSIASSRGISVVPAEPGSEAELAERLALPLAGRSRKGDSRVPWTLSPGAMARARPVEAVVLSSPNGAAISVVAHSAGARIVPGCLRNLTATVSFLACSTGSVGVIAAGETWPEGGLRPALEDEISAGLICQALEKAGFELSPDAELVARSVAGLDKEEVRRLVSASYSARELAERGFADDVALATELDSDEVVPLLSEQAPGFVASG
jgi:2-phosphosulfolactate phosphatase